MKFADIIHHDAVKQRLRAMIDADRLPHALLLHGPRGIGKFMMARAAAQYIHCENPIDGDSCGKCPSCLQHQSFNHIDTLYSFPVVKRNSSDKTTVSDDFFPEWRQFLGESPYMDFAEWMRLIKAGNTQPTFYVSESDDLIHKLNFTTHRSRYKVVLMWLPERMPDATANKLLKLIEEPHDDVKFILVSEKPDKILPTIFSRTQRIEMKRLPDDVIASHIGPLYGLEPTDAMAIAHMAEGDMLSAYATMSLSSDQKEYLELFVSLMRLAYQRNVAELKDWSIKVAGFGRERIMHFLRYCQRLIRENFIYNIQVPHLNYMNHDEANFSRNFARFVNERNVLDISTEIDKTLNDIEANSMAKIVLFDFAVRMIIYLKA